MATRLQHGGTVTIFGHLNIAYSVLSAASPPPGHSCNVTFPVVTVCIMLEMRFFLAIPSMEELNYVPH